MEPWEALDVDDSDLPFLLRPCKRPHGGEPPISSNLGSQPPYQPLLTPCSHDSKTLEHEQEASQPPPPPPPSPPSQQRRPENFHSDSRLIHRSIPGPAGAVQLAMRQKTRDREHRDLSSSERVDINPICTQEYINRAVKNDAEFDEDFTRDPWLSALKYFGTVNDVVHAIPLKNIKGCKSVGKIDQVVAVIGSCRHNNRGGLTVTLKDPTGVIGAYIHHKVLNKSNFAKCLHVGSVLILQKVSVFSPSKSVCYLNIMPRNVVKVITKDSTSISEQDASTKSVILGEGCSQRAGSVEKSCSLNNGICEDLPEQCRNMRVGLQANAGNCVDLEEEYTNRRGSVQANAVICEDEQYATRRGSLQANAGICEDLQSQSTNRRGILQANTGISEDLREQYTNRRESLRPDKEPLVQQPDVSQGLSEAVVKNKTGDYEQGFSRGNFEEEGVGFSYDKLRSEEEIEGNTGQSQRVPVISSASLPQWTDEQLAELFADEDMDDIV